MPQYITERDGDAKIMKTIQLIIIMDFYISLDAFQFLGNNLSWRNLFVYYAISFDGWIGEGDSGLMETRSINQLNW